MKIGWADCETQNPEETIQQGKRFAGYMEKGDVYGFVGDLASGKTTFIQGILKGLSYSKAVTSPTFTLINEYDANIPVIHIDCYRESNSQRWIKLGLNDYFNEENIVIVEWADKMEKLLPRDTIQLEFVHRGIDTREIKLITS